jgi:hypothetical protein
LHFGSGKKRNALARRGIFSKFASSEGVCIAVELRWEREFVIREFIVLMAFDVIYVGLSWEAFDEGVDCGNNVKFRVEGG